uniref:ISM1-like protein n=1 Tax=Hofstenia miamia TaxID=442651 RepID=A0A5P8I4M9_HOFMI|nr:ISM1-like protein [Hofstenia miamia]
MSTEIHFSTITFLAVATVSLLYIDGAPLQTKPQSKKTNSESSEEINDECKNWANCDDDKEIQAMLKKLPSCPCNLSSSLYIFGKLDIFDKAMGYNITWVKEEDALIYPNRSIAEMCIRTIDNISPTTVGSQVCCYNSNSKLITHGKSAGIPSAIHPEEKKEYKNFDTIPWLICKGDWVQVHKKRPPNNGLSCPVYPLKAHTSTEMY